MQATSLDNDYFMTAGLNCYERDRDIEEVHELQSWPAELQVFAPKPILHASPDGSWWGETVFKAKATATRIVSPKIRLFLTSKFQNDELMLGWINVRLIEYLADQVREAARDS